MERDIRDDQNKMVWPGTERHEEDRKELAKNQKEKSVGRRDWKLCDPQPV